MAPLHYMAIAGNCKAMELLLAAGADIDAQGDVSTNLLPNHLSDTQLIDRHTANVHHSLVGSDLIYAG